MDPRKRYSDKALECTSAADHAHDPGERLKLLAIARLFMSLAEHVTGRLDHNTQHRLPVHPDGHRVGATRRDKTICFRWDWNHAAGSFLIHLLPPISHLNMRNASADGRLISLLHVINSQTVILAFDLDGGKNATDLLDSDPLIRDNQERRYFIFRRL
jgi:hypothetical protein